MITPVLLVEELRDFIEPIVQNYWLETNKGISKPPQVITGYLPPKDPAKDDPDFPFVIVRLVDGTDDQDGATVTVNIIVGSYSRDSQQGWKDVANVIQRIWTELFKRRTIGNRFRVEYPMNFEIPEDQPYPHWVGIMTTTWTVAHPLPDAILEGNEYE